MFYFTCSGRFLDTPRFRASRGAKAVNRRQQTQRRCADQPSRRSHSQRCVDRSSSTGGGAPFRRRGGGRGRTNRDAPSSRTQTTVAFSFSNRPSARRGPGTESMDRNVRSKCRCSCILQFTCRRAICCVLHRPTSQVIHRSGLFFLSFLIVLCGRETIVTQGILVT